MSIVMGQLSVIAIAAACAILSAAGLAVILCVCFRRNFLNTPPKVPQGSTVRTYFIGRKISEDDETEDSIPSPPKPRKKTPQPIKVPRLESQSSTCSTPKSAYTSFSLPPSFRENVSTEKPQAPISPLSPRTPSMHRKLDPSQLDPNSYMYQEIKAKRSSGKSEGPCLGIINFSLKYNPEMGLLTINLIQARNLQPREFSGTADPYCKVAVVPHVSKMVQSRVQRKTVTPEFKESFVFEVPEPDIHRQTVKIQLYDYDQFSRDECIGVALLPLINVDLTEKVEVWKEIKKTESDSKVGEAIPELGDLMFSIAYLPSAERLTIVIMKARNIRHVNTAEGRKSSNTYVKVSLYFMSKRLKKKKTSTKHGTPNPVFNEALVFNVPHHFLKHLKLEIQVTHENKLGQNEVIGRMEVGPDSQGEELAHWNDMISSCKPVARWHRLCP